MKHTALYQKHIDLNAKMVPYAGFQMPVQYAGVKVEHLAVRNSVGVFDVSHMGEFVLTGKDSTALLQWICSNDIEKLVDYQCQYNCMPNVNGGIVDDLIVYKWADSEYNLVVNAANIQKDFDWIQSQIKAKGFDVKLENVSDDCSLIALQGPKAKEVLKKLTEVDLEVLKYYHFVPASVAGINDIILSNTGYTGSGGYELYVWNKDAPQLWNALLQAGKEYELQPCGLAARDTLRLEKGFCLYGNDINDETTPLEAGLGWVTKFNKDFVAKEILLKQKEEGLKKRLVAFKMTERGIPRKGYVLVNNAGQEIGVVTSGTQSPLLECGIGLGYVNVNYKKVGTEISVQIRNKNITAKIVKLPFA